MTLIYIPDMESYYISNQKVRELGWDIKIKFEDGLKELVTPSIN